MTMNFTILVSLTPKIFHTKFVEEFDYVLIHRGQLPITIGHLNDSMFVGFSPHLIDAIYLDFFLSFFLMFIA